MIICNRLNKVSIQANSKLSHILRYDRESNMMEYVGADMNRIYTSWLGMRYQRCLIPSKSVKLWNGIGELNLIHSMSGRWARNGSEMIYE